MALGRLPALVEVCRRGDDWGSVRRNGEMVSDRDPEKSNRVMQALLRMKKIDVAELETAYEQRTTA